MDTAKTYTAFVGHRLLVAGDLRTMLLRAKAHLDEGGDDPLLIFEDQTGQQIDFDFRGSPDDVLGRLPTHPHFADSEEPVPTRRGPGRPKLGVVSREVSLLPRHWRWLEEQPGSVSVTLRRLVEDARLRDHGATLARMARDAAGKFMWSMAGNLPHFEEASRALYADEMDRLASLIGEWPEDVRQHVARLVARYRELAEVVAKDDGPGAATARRPKGSPGLP